MKEAAGIPVCVEEDSVRARDELRKQHGHLHRNHFLDDEFYGQSSSKEARLLPHPRHGKGLVSSKDASCCLCINSSACPSRFLSSRASTLNSMPESH